MGYKDRDTYLPCKYWIADGKLHRAFYEYETDLWMDSPRDWDNLGIIVNFSDYCLTGSGDEKVRNMSAEEWFINATGINEDWYYSHENYGLDDLVNKFIKEKCVAFQWLNVYDHSGITVSCGQAYGWDYSNVGFIYVPKDCQEVKNELKGEASYNGEVYNKWKPKTMKEIREWADSVIKTEIATLNDYVQGNVYCLVCEIYDEETEEWEIGDSLGMVYLTSDSLDEMNRMAIDEIKGDMSGKNELIDEVVAEKAIEENKVDVLMGQKLFEFMEN